MYDDALEDSVRSGLEAILARYQVLESVADRWIEDGLPEQWDAIATQIQTERDAIAAIENASRQDQQQYRASRPQASTAVKRLTTELTELMQRLLLKLANLERQAVTARGALVPQLNLEIKAIQMKNAYSKYA